MGSSLIPGVKGREGAPGRLDRGTLAFVKSPVPRVQDGLGTQQPGLVPSHEEFLLAGIAYGEASERNVYEEMAAIANVLVRQGTARNYVGLAEFLNKDRTFAFAASDGNPRVALFREASPETCQMDAGMLAALRAARNALSAHGHDYSNGAYFWDGRDIATNALHPKRRAGLKFTKPEHDIFGIGDQLLKQAIVKYWTHKGKQTKERGRYQWVYESTAAWGQTIFWRLNQAYLQAAGGRPWAG